MDERGPPPTESGGNSNQAPAHAASPSSVRFGARHVAAALGLGVGIIGLAILFAGFATVSLSELLGGPDGPRHTLALLIFMQAFIAVFSVLAAARFGPRDEILAFGPVVGGWRAFFTVLAVMAGVLGPYTILTMLWFPNLVQGDLGQFKSVLSNELVVPAFIVLAIGAPLSEELLFRGFLTGVLCRSWLGYSGAGLVATLGWTGLHWGYSPVGLIEVVLAGLIFSWALWRTRSIIVPIACHAIYNAIVLVVLWSISFGG